MVSPNEAGFNLREKSPLPRHILHTPKLMITRSKVNGSTGQQPNLTVQGVPRGYRCRLTISAIEIGYLITLSPVGIPQSAAWVAVGNRHLPYLAESVIVNVGDLSQAAKVCSPPMLERGVGATIVV